MVKKEYENLDIEKGYSKRYKYILYLINKMKFQIINYQGMDIIDEYGIYYHYPYLSEFEGERVDYEKVIICGINKQIKIQEDNILYAIELNVIEDLFWQIIVLSDKGVHVYKDKELNEYTYSYPKNSKIKIKNRMIVNGMNVFQTYDNNYIGHDCFSYLFHSTFDIKTNNPSPLHMYLLPIRYILFGKVVNKDGLLVRKTKDIFSTVIGILNINATIYLKNKDFSSVPLQNNIHRFELINNKGWINLYSINDIPNFEIYGYVPTNEDISQLEISIIDLDQNSIFQKKENLCITCMNREPNSVFIHGNSGHSVCCFSCSKKLRNNKCPICKQDIEKTIQIY